MFQGCITRELRLPERVPTSAKEPPPPLPYRDTSLIRKRPPPQDPHPKTDTPITSSLERTAVPPLIGPACSPPRLHTPPTLGPLGFSSSQHRRTPEIVHFPGNASREMLAFFFSLKDSLAPVSGGLSDVGHQHTHSGRSLLSKFITEVPLLQEKAHPYDPTVGLCLGS